MTSTLPTARRSDYLLAGTLLEVCSCGVVCPCFVGEDPDGGSCVGLIAYHLDHGEIGGVDVSGLSIANIAQIPGNALAGGWRVVIVVDDEASDDQHDALLAAFGGQLGGGLADLAGLVDEVVAIERAPILHAVQAGRGSIRIEGMLEAEIGPITGASGEQTTLRETMFSTVPGAPAYVSKASRFTVDLPRYRMTWTFEGHNAVQTAWRMEHSG
jgi:hypothetical protein